MGNGTSPLAFLVLTILLKITSQQTVDICSGPTHLRAAGCAPEEEVIECNSEGKYCYIYDALLPFCPQHETFFDSPFGAIRAEGPPTCTTTTTGTFTVTTTYTRTATVFTSTRGQAIECRDFCYENTHPWIVKCGWSVCASCGECAAILLPSTSQATSSGQEGMFTTRPVRRNTTLPPTTSAAPGGQSGGSGSGGGGVPVYKSDGSLEEAAQSDQTTVQGEATTSQELQSKACLKLQLGHLRPLPRMFRHQRDCDFVDDASNCDFHLLHNSGFSNKSIHHKQYYQIYHYHAFNDTYNDQHSDDHIDHD